MRIPVLTYHSMNIAGNEYAGNDHVAFADDLRTIDDARLRIVPLHRLTADWLSGASDASMDGLVALTCDDGGDFDFEDLDHPVAGTQRSMHNLLRDFQHERPGAQPGLFLTSFVIVSPLARQQLDRTCMIGRGWWNDTWWNSAIRSGLMGIGNHSWDHNHETLDDSDFPGLSRGTFESIDTQALADFQVAQASRHLRGAAPNPADRLFAYPYGEANDYLVNEYFPRFGAELGIDAAFGGPAGPMTEGSNRWRIPRFVAGRDWKSGDELRHLLHDATGR
jgi:hypothetical protein